jgi:hypothetical protein
MEEHRLDNEIRRLYEKFPFLWNDHGFHVNYFTRDYGMYSTGFIIGLENDVCRLAFEKESNPPVERIRDYVGISSALFAPPDHSYIAEYGWYSLTGLMFWLSGVEYEVDKDIARDLENLSQYLRLHMDNLLELFKYPDEFDRKLDHLQSQHKENQITLEKIHEEQARLQALGRDSSLEAIIASLRGGKR